MSCGPQCKGNEEIKQGYINIFNVFIHTNPSNGSQSGGQVTLRGRWVITVGQINFVFYIYIFLLCHSGRKKITDFQCLSKYVFFLGITEGGAAAKVWETMIFTDKMP